MTKGWKFEGARPSLARKGIKTVPRALKAQDYIEITAPFGKQAIADHLQVETKVLVPSTLHDKEISAKEFAARAKETEDFLSRIFGGYTAVEAKGGWVEKGKVIAEPVIEVVSFTKAKDYFANRQKLLTFLKAKKKEWKQNAVSVEIEGDLFLI